jgi:type IV pilus assembly protein PilN
MRRINLLPSEDRRRGVALPGATRSGLLGVLLILGALLLLVMIGLYLYYYIQLGNEEEQITQLDQDIAREQARIQELAPFQDLQARLDAKKPIADGIFRTRFPWDEFLRGLAFVIPESTALDVFAGQATPINIQAPAGGAPEVQNLEPPGTITFNGFAAPENVNADDEPKYQYVSDFIVRMNNLRFLANADLASAELDRETFEEDAINFEVGADLVTRIGENGDEVLLGTEEDGAGEGDEENGAADEGAGAPGARASRAGVGR